MNNRYLAAQFMQLSSNSATSDFDRESRDNSAIEYDWQEVIEYTKSKSRFDIDIASIAAAISSTAYCDLYGRVRFKVIENSDDL